MYEIGHPSQSSIQDRNIDYGSQLVSDDAEKMSMLLNALDLRDDITFTDVSFLVICICISYLLY